ncbi:MAG: hypothetical protein U5L09_03280 [Bacteroidales bacterium]|nr:hypothetical protein [Bacteroidales bacterium]
MITGVTLLPADGRADSGRHHQYMAQQGTRNHSCGDHYFLHLYTNDVVADDCKKTYPEKS